MPIKEDLPFHPVRIAVLTVSDSRDLSTDKSVKPWTPHRR